MATKKLSTKDFNLMYEALRAKKNPEVRPVKGSMYGQKSYREQ